MGEAEKKKNQISNATVATTTIATRIRSGVVTVGATPSYCGRSPLMLRSHGVWWRTVGACPAICSYARLRRPSAQTRAKLMSANVATTTNTAVIVGGPPPCTRDPTHSASKGPPVQTLRARTVIAADNATRLGMNALLSDVGFD
ncbi:MAG TPA: hypothetical protein VEX39_03185 [Thermoleophilaceae bacterium]|nr:hypothetical protein [Thermoleophilaceae bacterium]